MLKAAFLGGEMNSIIYAVINSVELNMQVRCITSKEMFDMQFN